MQITKKQSRWLRYMARANYKANYENRDTSDGKVKHRVFPCYGLSYDETTVGKGLCELTNIVISGNPFDGTYDDLMMELSAILDGKDAVEPLRTLSGALSRLLPEGSEVTERVEGDTLVVDVRTVESRTVARVELEVTASPQPDIVGAQGAGNTTITEDATADEPTDTTADDTVVDIPEEPTPKPVRTAPELYALRIRCATRRLATLYGERPDMGIGEIFSRHPNATERLNALYATDGIKPYTVSEDAIRKAYPTEYAALEQASPDQSPLPKCNPIASRQDSTMMARQEAHPPLGGR